MILDNGKQRLMVLFLFLKFYMNAGGLKRRHKNARFTNLKIFLLLPRSVELLGDGLQEVLCVEVHALFDIWQSMDAGSQILGHFSRLDGVDAGLLEGLRESSEVFVVVQFGAVFETY